MNRTSRDSLRNRSIQHSLFLCLLLLTGIFLGSVGSHVFLMGNLTTGVMSRDVSARLGTVRYTLLDGGRLFALLVLLSATAAGTVLVPLFLVFTGVVMGGTAAFLLSFGGLPYMLLLAGRVLVILPFALFLGSWSVSRSLSCGKGPVISPLLLSFSVLILIIAWFLDFLIIRLTGGIF